MADIAYVAKLQNILKIDRKLNFNKSAYKKHNRYMHVTPSRKHAYIILTPLNPTFIQKNLGLEGYTLFFFILLKT